MANTRGKRTKLKLNNYADVPEIDDQEKMIRPMIRRITKRDSDNDGSNSQVQPEQYQFLDMAGDRPKKNSINIVAAGVVNTKTQITPNSNKFKSQEH